MSDLHALVDQGIIYEDDFVETYFRMLRDEGFMVTFGDHAQEATALFTTMIDESRAHKAGLERLKQTLT